MELAYQTVCVFLFEKFKHLICIVLPEIFV
jgi:hypothetical protein